MNAYVAVHEIRYRDPSDNVLFATGKFDVNGEPILVHEEVVIAPGTVFVPAACLNLQFLLRNGAIRQPMEHELAAYHLAKPGRTATSWAPLAAETATASSTGSDLVG